MSRKNTVSIRISPEDKKKLDNMRLNIQAEERKNISTAETLRRTMNIPNLSDVLLQDARAKKFRRILK